MPGRTRHQGGFCQSFDFGDVHVSNWVTSCPEPCRSWRELWDLGHPSGHTVGHRCP